MSRRTPDARLVLAQLRQQACTDASVTKSKIDSTSFSLRFTVQKMQKKNLERAAASVVSDLCRSLLLRGITAVPCPALAVGTLQPGKREKYQADVQSGITIEPLPKTTADTAYIHRLAEALLVARCPVPVKDHPFTYGNVSVKAVDGFGSVTVRVDLRTNRPLSKTITTEAYDDVIRFFNYFLVPALNLAGCLLSVPFDVQHPPTTLVSVKVPEAQSSNKTSILTFAGVLNLNKA